MKYVTKLRQTHTQPFEGNEFGTILPLTCKTVCTKIGHVESLRKFNFTEMKGAFFLRLIADLVRLCR